MSYTVAELGQLRMAVRWGLMRQLPANLRQVKLVGDFTLDADDMRQLVKAAGGSVEPAFWRASDVDLVVVGRVEDRDQVMEALQLQLRDQLTVVTDEAGLVELLLPRWDHLVTPPGQPPF